MNCTTLNILKSSFWQKPIPSEEITSEVYQELYDQTISVLVYDVIGHCKVDDTLKMKWTEAFARQVATFVNYLEEQERLVTLLQSKGYTPAILKGLSAAMYYPEPAYRAVGDIDFLPFPRENDGVEKISELLRNSGFIFSEDNNPRHLGFSKNGISYEMHRYFSMKETKGEKEIDELIEGSTVVERCLKGWPEYHFYSFPDEINGLIFLQHINQHLISGLGLRQIIDWMFFVESVVTDEFWKQTLKPLTDKVGLTTLAITVTKMCEIYLEEPKHSWAATADEKVCRELFQLLDESGNFGRKKNRKDNSVTTVLNQRAGGFKGLQQRGLHHWPAAQKHRILRPFAWLYQIGRYIKKGLFERDKNSEGLWASYKRHKEQDRLFKKLGLWKYRK